MERRPFLALLTTTLAGCGANSQSTTEPTGPPPETETSTSTASSTPSPTERPTDTPTETPSDDVRQAQELLAEVESTLDAAIEQYVGDAGESILAADASYVAFDGRIVLAALDEAKMERQTAREAVVTDGQRRTVEALATMEQFLRAATETQASLVGAYYHLQQARESLAAENHKAAETDLTRMDAERRIARSPYETLVEETNAAAADAVSRLDRETYRRKRAQFDAERRAFGRIREPLDELVRAVGRLESARALQQNGSTDQAEQTARATVQRLESAAASLATFAEGLDRPADSLVGVSRALRDLAREKADATREAFDISDATTTTAT